MLGWRQFTATSCTLVFVPLDSGFMCLSAWSHKHEPLSKLKFEQVTFTLRYNEIWLCDMFTQATSCYAPRFQKNCGWQIFQFDLVWLIVVVWTSSVIPHTVDWVVSPYCLLPGSVQTENWKGRSLVHCTTRVTIVHALAPWVLVRDWG